MLGEIITRSPAVYFYSIYQYSIPKLIKQGWVTTKH
jgi:hypothetical protein